MSPPVSHQQRHARTDPSPVAWLWWVTGFVFLVFCCALMVWLAKRHARRTTTSDCRLQQEPQHDGRHQHDSSSDAHHQRTLVQDTQFPIYVISLPWDMTRRQFISSWLNPRPFEFVDAVDTRGEQWNQYRHQLSPAAMQRLTETVHHGKRKHHHELTPGAVGCFLSHLLVYERFLGSSSSLSEWALVLEDDCACIPDAFGIMSQFQNTVDTYTGTKPDIVLFSHLIFGSITPVPAMPTIHGRTFYQLETQSQFYLLNAYFISKRGALNILERFHQEANGLIGMQIDSYFSVLIQRGVLRVWACVPHLCRQAPVTETRIQNYAVIP